VSGLGKKRAGKGFTLIEVLVTLVIIGVMGTIAGTMVSDSQEDELARTATAAVMDEINKAILGPNTPLIRGVHLGGYVADMGGLPPLNANGQPEDLWRMTRGNSASRYHADARICTGWNGPYIQPPDSGFIADGWGTPLAFSLDRKGGSLKIQSYGADRKAGGTGLNADVLVTVSRHQYMAPLGLRLSGRAEDLAGSELSINFPGPADGSLQTAPLPLEPPGQFVSGDDAVFPIGLRSITAKIRHGNEEAVRTLVFAVQPGMNYLGVLE